METSEVMRNLRNATWPSPSSAPPSLVSLLADDNARDDQDCSGASPCTCPTSSRPIWKVKVASAVARRLRSLDGPRASLARGPHTISLVDRPTDGPTEFRIVISKSS